MPPDHRSRGKTCYRSQHILNVSEDFRSSPRKEPDLSTHATVEIEDSYNKYDPAGKAPVQKPSSQSVAPVDTVQSRKPAKNVGEEVQIQLPQAHIARTTLDARSTEVMAGQSANVRGRTDESGDRVHETPPRSLTNNIQMRKPAITHVSSATEALRKTKAPQGAFQADIVEKKQFTAQKAASPSEASIAKSTGRLPSRSRFSTAAPESPAITAKKGNGSRSKRKLPDDDEYEIPAEPDTVPPPQKKGRGRPKKQEAKTKPVSSKTSTKQSAKQQPRKNPKRAAKAENKLTEVRSDSAPSDEEMDPQKNFKPEFQKQGSSTARAVRDKDAIKTHQTADERSPKEQRNAGKHTEEENELVVDDEAVETFEQTHIRFHEAGTEDDIDSVARKRPRKADESHARATTGDADAFGEDADVTIGNATKSSGACKPEGSAATITIDSIPSSEADEVEHMASTRAGTTLSHTAATRQKPHARVAEGGLANSDVKTVQVSIHRDGERRDTSRASNNHGIRVSKDAAEGGVFSHVEKMYYRTEQRSSAAKMRVSYTQPLHVLQSPPEMSAPGRRDVRDLQSAPVNVANTAADEAASAAKPPLSSDFVADNYPSEHDVFTAPTTDLQREQARKRPNMFLPKSGSSKRSKRLDTDEAYPTSSEEHFSADVNADVEEPSQTSNKVDYNGSPIPPDMVVPGNATALEVYNRQQRKKPDTEIEGARTRSQAYSTLVIERDAPLYAPEANMIHAKLEVSHAVTSVMQKKPPQVHTYRGVTQDVTEALELSRSDDEVPDTQKDGQFPTLLGPEDSNLITRTTAAQQTVTEEQPITDKQKSSMEVDLHDVDKHEVKQRSRSKHDHIFSASKSALPCVENALATSHSRHQTKLDNERPVTTSFKENDPPGNAIVNPNNKQQTNKLTEALREFTSGARPVTSLDKSGTPFLVTHAHKRHDRLEDEDPDKTLVEEEAHALRDAEMSDDEESMSSESAMEESTPASQDTQAATEVWRSSLAPHQGDLLEALITVSHHLVRHLVDKETAIADILTDYRNDGLRLIDAMEIEQKAALGDYNETVRKSLQQLCAGLDKTERVLHKQMKEVQRSRNGIQVIGRDQGVIDTKSKLNGLIGKCEY